ncbi:MAG TPA: hypothetical protein VKG80_14265, partial [Trebonia sp.]|nr:hypothetical protein [Trebonia sp.]
VTRDVLVQDAYESELPRVLGMLAAIWQLTLFVQIVLYLREYRDPAVPVLAWTGLALAAWWLIPRTRAGDVTGREAACAVAIAVAAVSLCGWADRLPGAVGSVDWSVFGTSWLLALVAVGRPAWEWVSGALLVRKGVDLAARKMAISEETAKQYLSRVRDKYGRAGRSAPTKIELYYRAVEDGHIPPLR